MSLFVFTAEADAEIAEAFAWYEQRSPGLGQEFLRAVEVAVTSAAHAPLRYPVWRRGAHRMLLHKFPFAIFYTVTSDGIIIFACFHGRRNPKVLINRH